MAEKGTAVVAEVGWANGLAAIRSLGRHGLRVIAVDNKAHALGFRSRYAEQRLVPDPLDDEAGYIAAFEAIARETDGLLPVFPTHDEHLNALARHTADLDERYRFPFPELGRAREHPVEAPPARHRRGDRLPHPAHVPSAHGGRGAGGGRGDRLSAARQAGRERRLPAHPQRAALPLRERH